jgi:hypothetical protein
LADTCCQDCRFSGFLRIHPTAGEKFLTFEDRGSDDTGTRQNTVAATEVLPGFHVLLPGQKTGHHFENTLLIHTTSVSDAQKFQNKRGHANKFRGNLLGLGRPGGVVSPRTATMPKRVKSLSGAEAPRLSRRRHTTRPHAPKSSFDLCLTRALRSLARDAGAVSVLYIGALPGKLPATWP